jgi:hypothetical protein
MKRAKFLVLAVVVATSMMGAGYAAWTDGFKTTSTVKTGNLDVQITGANATAYVVVNTDNYNGNDYKSLTHQYTDYSTIKADNLIATQPQIDNDTKSITYNFENLYPGAETVGQLTVQNMGTMPAAIQKVNVTLEDTDKYLSDNIWVIYDFSIKNVKDIKDPNVAPRKKIHGECFLKDFGNSLAKKLEGEYLLPDEVLTADPDNTTEQEQAGYTVRFKFEKGNFNGDNGEKLSATIKVDFNFVQHNLFDTNKVTKP